MLEKTLESPLDCKEIQPVHPKGDQSWKTDAEAETPILWPPDAKSWLIGKDLDVRKDWGQGEKRVTEDKMVAWHHRLNGHESEQILGDSEGQGSLVCCSPWGHKESDTTEWLNWIEGKSYYVVGLGRYASSQEKQLTWVGKEMVSKGNRWRPSKRREASEKKVKDRRFQQRSSMHCLEQQRELSCWWICK